MKNILVTGGLGYIGSHVVVELVASGYDVLIVDDLSNSQRSVLDRLDGITGKKLHFVEGDLSDKTFTEALFAYHRIDAIIHFAAKKAVGESVDKPLLYYRINLGSMMNLLEGMTAHGVNHLVFSSSCTVYGQPDQLPVTEKTPMQAPASPYGHTKQVCEYMLSDTIRANAHLRGTSLRYFNPVGAHASAQIGELPLGIPNNLVPFITQAGIGLRDELKVFGGDYNTPDGTAIRDYIHVVDLAKAHVSALERQFTESIPYEVFNVGAGKGHSVLEVIQSFERVSGQKLNYRIVDRRPGDIEQIWADTKLANNALNWTAEKNLDEMMLDAWSWQKSLDVK